MIDDAGSNINEDEKSQRINNSWVICLNDLNTYEHYSVTTHDNELFDGMAQEDWVILIDEDTSEYIAFARVLRYRNEREKSILYFDKISIIKQHVVAKELLEVYSQPINIVERLDWDLFETVARNVLDIPFTDIPLIGSLEKDKAYIRQLMQLALADDLLGPAEGPEELIIGMSVRDRYLVGKLSPVNKLGETSKIQPVSENIDSDEDLTEYKNEGHIGIEKKPVTEFSEDTDEDTDSSENSSIVPNSIGMTFCIDCDVDALEISAYWGRYIREVIETIDDPTGRPKRGWRRIPSGGTSKVLINGTKLEPVMVDPECEDVFIQGKISNPLPNGDRLITLFLVNKQVLPDKNQDEAWIFQPEIIVRDVKGKAIFKKKPILNQVDFDSERKTLEMLYRHQVEFAMGHGVSVSASATVENPELAYEVKSVVIPKYEIQVTETPGLYENDRPAMKRLFHDGYLDMEKLANLDVGELIEAFNILSDDYESWINEIKEKSIHLMGFEDVSRDTCEKCEIILSRLREGIDILKEDEKALTAFRFANRAMASQRVHSILSLKRRRGESIDLSACNIRQNRTWRPFQLAFILLSIPSLADPCHKDRTEPLEAFADLLWFPTGGGKTEAYLGVAAFAMAIRRLHGELGGYDGGRGLTVIMRYTLRLLTIQQFQRATALVCAMEILRKNEPAIWGDTPFTIGLWVGKNVTPNSTEDSHDAIMAARNQRNQKSSPAQLTFCPWCGSKIDEASDIEVLGFNNNIGKTTIYCSDNRGPCEFSKIKAKNEGLPIVVVDEEIYRRPPSILIATVDKFAMMAWKGETRTLFGKVTQECLRHGFIWPESSCTGEHRATRELLSTKCNSILPVRPPDLIIQDEFHLISGPLGTMVGLYETAVDELSTWKLNGKKVRPKIIASTATIRKADYQIRNVFLRQVSVFPPNGLEVGDNFFSIQREIEDRPGRLYLGICAPGSSRPAVLIRVFVALLTAGRALYKSFGAAADPYMTAVGYFNSLRELGGMRRLAEDDVQTRCYRVEMSDVKRPGLMQREIKNIDELTSRVSSKDIPNKLDQLEVQYKEKAAKDEEKAIDVVLATNMFSVGVDVNRLGLMVVNGQPKNTAEYIQATSRVGRSYPGLICTVLTWARPRDLSHYETFEHYHACFYKHVEAQSVTPYSPRALDRGLTGVIVSMMRLENEELNPNLGAENFSDTNGDAANIIKERVKARAWNIKDRLTSQLAEKMCQDRLDRWAKEATKPGRRLGYEKKDANTAALLKKPGNMSWDELTVPMSMREVEPGVRLVLDDRVLDEEPAWNKTHTVDHERGEEI